MGKAQNRMRISNRVRSGPNAIRFWPKADIAKLPVNIPLPPSLRGEPPGARNGSNRLLRQNALSEPGDCNAAERKAIWCGQERKSRTPHDRDWHKCPLLRVKRTSNYFRECALSDAMRPYALISLITETFHECAALPSAKNP
jgi:hypothetical protein